MVNLTWILYILSVFWYLMGISTNQQSMDFFDNVKSGLINIPLLINLLLPPKKMQFKNRWSPQINKLWHTPD